MRQLRGLRESINLKQIVMLNLVKVLIIFSFGIVSCKDGSDNMKSDFQGKSLENLQKTKLFKNFISLRELNLGDGY